MLLFPLIDHSNESQESSRGEIKKSNESSAGEISKKYIFFSIKKAHLESCLLTCCIRLNELCIYILFSYSEWIYISKGDNSGLKLFACFLKGWLLLKERICSLPLSFKSSSI